MPYTPTVTGHAERAGEFARSPDAVPGAKRILIVDDNRAFTELAKLNLESAGPYEVLVENRSVRAVSVARSFHPDLVLLDFIMPHRDGGEVSRDFKSDPSLSGVPIIMMTASLTARDTGESGFIVRNGQVIVAKPTRTAKLIELIDAQIAAAQG